MSKCKLIGIQGKFFLCIDDYMSYQMQYVKFEKISSEENAVKFFQLSMARVSTGVPQGSILESLLLLICINDTLDCIP